VKAAALLRPVVRIQAGKWKGRRLEVPPGARPTSGRARAALFNLLGPERLAGARVLDLFAGSGAVGLEAVSRGAALAVLVEREGGPVARTLARHSISPAEARLAAGPAASALAALARAGERFDVVFADPPYGMDAGADLDRAAGMLAAGGELVVQADEAAQVATPRGLAALSRRAYGRNVFHFFGIL
jgi:16S rRNA (guanine966-N2)-methyltransferase